MAETYATLDQLRGYWPDLPATQEGAAETRLSVASHEVRAHAGGEPDADEEVLAYICCDMVKRAMQSGSPVTQQSATAGPYSVSQSFANPMGKLYWDPEYDRLLGIGRVAFCSIRPAIGGEDDDG